RDHGLKTKLMAWTDIADTDSPSSYGLSDVVARTGRISDRDDEPLALWHAHMLLMLHHLIHHHLLHTHVPVHHVLMLLHLLRRHLGVVAAHLIPAHHVAPTHHLTVTHHVATAHHLTVTHHVTALHAPSAAPHHSAATHSVHHVHSLLHHGLVLLHQFLTLCRAGSFLNLAHLLLHFFQVFLCLCHLLIKLLNAHWLLLSLAGGAGVLLRKG